MSDLAPGKGSSHEASQSDSQIIEITTARGQFRITKGFCDLLVAVAWYSTVMSLIKKKFGLGDEKPSAIPEKMIVPFLTVFDVIKQSLCGEGSVETILFRILERLDYGLDECQALVLASHNGYALVIEEVLQEFGKDLGLKVCACIGGKKNSIRKDQRRLSNGVHIVVGTPGRVVKLLNRQILRPDHIKMFAFNEPKMLSCGYKDQIYDVLRVLPPKAQLCLSSNTLLPGTIEILRKFMKNPVRILVGNLRCQEEGIKRFYVIVEKEYWKLEILCHIFKTLAMSQCVIIVKTPRNVDWLADKMRSKGYSVLATHEYMDRDVKDSNMRDFQLGSSRVLISTTDLLVCATFLQQISLVINYDFVSSSGSLGNWRRGRFGRVGVVIDFLTTFDEESLPADFQRSYNAVVVDVSSPDAAAETPL